MRSSLTKPFGAVLVTLAMLAALLAVLAYQSSFRAVAATPVTFMGAGDIAACGDWSEPNAIANGDLIREANPDKVFALGDNAYDDGTTQQYNDCYDPAWGSFKAKTYPVPGNHEYHTANAQGYLDYFGTAKVKNTTDNGTYYAVDLGNNWRYYALNSEVSMSAGSAQETWLRNDLAAHPGMHYIGGWHRPRYSQGMHGNSTSPCPLWNDLMAAKADLVLVGHDHLYQRFAKMDCSSTAKADGIRQFLIGSGGNQTYAQGTSSPAPQFSDDKTFGVLKLSLYPDSYDWQFISNGRQFSASTGGVDVGNKGAVLDSGSAATNVGGVTPTATSTPTPTTTATPTTAPTPTGTPTATPTGGTTTVETRVAASSDDAESRGSSTDLVSTDLELTTDGSTNQTVATRFAGLAVPQGATITDAYVEFTDDEVTTGPGAAVTIKAENADSAATYTAAATSITGRATTGSVSWSPDAWSTVGAFKRTPNIASLVQGVVDRPGWASGNALALQYSGTGTRTAESIDGTAAPLLHVEYSTGPTTSTTATPSPTQTTSPSPTSTPTDPGFPTSRDKYEWPFTSDSIWNMPIGSGAKYADAGLTNLGTPTQPDEEYLGVNPGDPLKNLTSGDEGALGQVHVPGNISWDGRWNGSTTLLSGDNDHIWQGQPLTLAQGGNPTWNDTFPHIDPSTRQWQDTAWQYSLSQDNGIYGAHGGSHLSAIGGTIREGELGGTTPIRHALKINVYGAKFLFDAGCGGLCGGFRWPAATSDDYGSNDNNYGTQQPQLGNPNPAMKMGALLALPPTFDVSMLQTAQARKIAQALKDYGAYITDDSASNNYAFAVEYDALDEWRGGDGWYPALSPDDPAVQADLNSLYSQMKVVDNNSPTSVGGGGTPRQPLAPPFSGGTPTNQAPNVSAGMDATITLPDAAAPDGTVNDDGQPTGSTVTQQWSRVSGPGTVAFGNADAVDTTASFSTDGTYVLRLTATDGAASSSDDVTVTVNPAAPDDTTPPDTTIESASFSGPSASFTFSSSEAGSTFEWRLNSGTWFAATGNSQSFDDLSPGTYTFEVRAIDRAGNVDPTPASHTRTVSATTPEPTFVVSNVTRGVSGKVTAQLPPEAQPGDKAIVSVQETSGTGGAITCPSTLTPLAAELNDGSSLGTRLYTYTVPAQSPVTSWECTVPVSYALMTTSTSVWRSVTSIAQVAQVAESSANDVAHPVSGTTTEEALNVVLANDRQYVSGGTAGCASWSVASSLDEKKDSCFASGNSSLSQSLGVTPFKVSAGAKTYTANASLPSSYAATVLVQVR